MTYIDMSVSQIQGLSLLSNFVKPGQMQYTFKKAHKCSINEQVNLK